MKKNTVILIVLAGLTVLGTSLYLSRGARPKTRHEKPRAQNRETSPGSVASSKTRHEKPQAQTGKTTWGNAPDISLTMLDGKSLKLSDFRGDLIVLNFWVESCGYCRMQMADLNRLHTEHKDRGVVVLGVNLDGYSIPRLQTFSEKKKLLYPVAAGDRYEAIGKYSVRGYPTTFIIDRKGDTTHRYIGYTSYKIFTAALQKSGAH